MKLRRALFVFCAMITFTLCGAMSSWAQTSPSTDDLQKKIDDLSQQLADVKAKLAAMQPAAAAPPAGANAAVATPAATPAAPTSPTLSSLLGPTSISGFVDTYYQYNSNTPSNLVNASSPFTPFHNQFGLNMVEFVVAKAPDTSNRTGYNLALGFGQAMNAVNAAEPRPGGLGFAQYLKEAYFSYLAPAGKGLQIDVGKFVTPAGAEVIESNANWNYTRSVLFYYAIPYFHFGARAKYTFNDKASLTGFLVNGWNNILDNNSGKTGGFSLALTPSKKWGITENFLVGPELASNSSTGSVVDPNGNNSSIRQLWDTVITYTPNSKVSWMLNGDYGRGDRFCLSASAGGTCITASTPVSWYGAAGYLKYAFHPKANIAGRYEYFNDPEGFATGIGLGQHWQEGTFTFERDISSHIISRLEYRYDATSQPFFPKGTSGLAKDQSTVALGMIFSFSSAEGGH